MNRNREDCNNTFCFQGFITNFKVSWWFKSLSVSWYSWTKHENQLLQLRVAYECSWSSSVCSQYGQGSASASISCRQRLLSCPTLVRRKHHLIYTKMECSHDLFSMLPMWFTLFKKRTHYHTYNLVPFERSWPLWSHFKRDLHSLWEITSTLS